MESMFILGASDPEMTRIERHLAGRWRYAYAMRDGHRVHPGNAYRADSYREVLSDACQARPEPAGVIFVECRLEDMGRAPPHVVVDHHHEGDPGFGLPPERYLEGSSLGQVLALLELRPTHEDRLIAAADHCPGGAYQGLCPGVDPADLAAFRTRERASWLLSRPAHAPERRALLGDVSVRGLERVYARTRSIVITAPQIYLGGHPVRDLRAYGTLPELPEVLARLGICALYRFVPPAGSRDRRVKVGVIGGGDGTVSGRGPIEAFLTEAPARFNLRDLYGDPARGYAGGYET